MKRKPWFYMGFVVLPADLNGSGMRWTCNCGIGRTLKAHTKEGMRGLIRSATYAANFQAAIKGPFKKDEYLEGILKKVHKGQP